MDKALASGSGILLKKSKFFLLRALTYFSFFLIPIWIPKSLSMNTLYQCLLMFLYILFMCAQWFLLGKEIDHRFKIYFKVNSSFDRITYRLLMGMFAISLYFNLLSFLPHKWIYNSFWATFIILGLFYSWPTRGKIIQESVSTNFYEFNYLDRFEKTLLFLIVGTFIVSIPRLPEVMSEPSLKLFFDPVKSVSAYFWNFLKVNYYPFRGYPKLYTVAWSMHFYVVGTGVFLFVSYALSRFFLSRRLSLLCVFAILSSWSFSKILANNFGDAITTTYTVIWVWSSLWVYKSSTYRAGLFLGLVGFWGSVLNPMYALFSFVQLIFLYSYLLRDKTPWYRRQVLKYYILGFILLLAVLGFNLNEAWNIELINRNYILMMQRYFDRKGIYSLCFVGLLVYFIKYFRPNKDLVRFFEIDKVRLEVLGASLIVITSFSLIATSVNRSFAPMWIFALLSLVPLELIFQSIRRLRSKRNVIFVIYILVCLLDSHLEGRIKIFFRLFQS